MLSYIANTNMAISGNYYKACQLLDMDNFMKYIAVNVFANNRDWPHNNVKAWMYQGKWHFVLKDIDYAWGIYDLPGRTENVIAEETSHSENVLRGRAGEISAMFASLMKNETFKKACDFNLDILAKKISEIYYSVPKKQRGKNLKMEKEKLT